MVILFYYYCSRRRLTHQGTNLGKVVCGTQRHQGVSPQAKCASQGVFCKCPTGAQLARTLRKHTLFGKLRQGCGRRTHWEGLNPFLCQFRFLLHWHRLSAKRKKSLLSAVVRKTLCLMRLWSSPQRESNREQNGNGRGAFPKEKKSAGRIVGPDSREDFQKHFWI